ncbi:hypothetical protein F9000_09210 [Bacteroides fragilis]|nr:hypothetical protein F9000_09210 [Bacteroides fragilis]KAB5430510.1 hypothetical protein F9Z99_07340 [Bacteroides fragilis]RHK12124.1 hypothetical protein DW078_21865 [Bacteroides fragilis]THC66454.1 hypothetical protein E7X03_01315 [Bacteroides fragilis]THC74818.1 hypothetical protein E7X19_08080 [Bacteroides fragilis]
MKKNHSSPFDLPPYTRRLESTSETNSLTYNRKKFTFQVKISFRAFCFPLMFNRKWYTMLYQPG